MFFGSIILVLGLVFLLKNLRIISGEVWPVIWPSLLIILGLSIFWKRKRHDEKWDKFGDGMRKFGEGIGKAFGGKEK